MPILQTIDVEKRFGGIVAAQNVNVAVEVNLARPSARARSRVPEWGGDAGKGR
jgi:hypothetical protein